MSLITQCPACTTLFKVVPDQLRVSDGWVRCGQCDEVFDANAHLQTTLQEARQSTFGESPRQSAPPRSGGVKKAPAAPLSTPVPAPVGASSDAVSQDEAEVKAYSAAVVPESDPPFVSSRMPSVADLDAAPVPLQSNAPTEAETEAAVRAEYEALLEAAELDAKALSDADPASGWGHDEVDGVDGTYVQSASELADAREAGESILSFMQTAPAPEVPVRPWVRPVWLVCSVLLVLALVLQVTVRERDRLVAKAPAMTPLLQGVCDVLDCQLSALREIESVVIDSSSFVKVRTDVYRVHITLKNTAIHPVATPAVELTLTSVMDQPIARRVILPQEFGINQAAMAPGAELVATVAIRAKLPTDSERITGYRLLAFYP